MKHHVPIVYIATNKMNNKKYIGVTCRKLYTRKSQHKYTAKTGGKTVFSKAIRKYGIDAFDFEVVSTFTTYEQAKLEEIKLISKIRPEYNLTLGGDGALGFKHSEENKQKMSEKAKGRPGFWKGKKLLPHVVELKRQHGKIRPDKNRILACGPRSRMKPVICETDDNKLFESINSCSRFYKIAPNTVIKSCNGTPLTSKHIFTYLNEWCPNPL